MKNYDTGRLMSVLASPKKLLSLKYISKKALTDSDNNVYSIYSGIPILIDENLELSWHRELMECILWEYPNELNDMYAKIPHNSDPNTAYKEIIKKFLKDKSGIVAALERYASNKTDKWIATDKLNDRDFRKRFKSHSSYFNGRKRVKTKKRPKNTFIYKHYKKFSEACFKNESKTIIELATGAGGGTASLAVNMNKNTNLYTVDISLNCLSNAFGIAKYTHRKNIFPICANFWYLPFKSESADLVCTFCGLDESRENNKTLSEIKRVLKHGGRFVCVSRKSSFMRQARILEGFGFNEKECEELMKKCRMYSSFENLKEQCLTAGLQFVNSEEMPKDEAVFVLSEFTKP